MGGSVYFAGAVVIIGLLCAVLVSPLFLIPAVVLVLVALFAAPLLAAISRGGGSAQTGVPSTQEASYEPVADPGERRA
jgi:uncharacterized membrane protein YdfJ with MMPL/SSD domain